MKDLNMLNEAFDNMFKNISESEAFNEDFDIEYAEMMNEIDNDSETMYKMYTSSGTISPADALYTLGYKDVPDEDALMSVINKNGTEYIKYFEFDYDDSYVYYVLKDGVIPRGWTATKAFLSNSEVNESVEILNEKIPKDLAKAYTASGNTQWTHKDGDFINKVDYENSKYKIESIADVSNKELATMYRITLPRRANFAKELIADLMNNFNIEKGESEFVYYSNNYPFEDDNTLIHKGLIRKSIKNNQSK